MQIHLLLNCIEIEYAEIHARSINNMNATSAQRWNRLLS